MRQLLMLLITQASYNELSRISFQGLPEVSYQQNFPSKSLSSNVTFTTTFIDFSQHIFSFLETQTLQQQTRENLFLQIIFDHRETHCSSSNFLCLYQVPWEDTLPEETNYFIPPIDHCIQVRVKKWKLVNLRHQFDLGYYIFFSHCVMTLVI